MDSYDSNQIVICWIFRDLEDLQSFAPLRSQNFRKKRGTILAVLNNSFKIIHSKFAFFKSKMRFFGKILMTFCRNFTNMLRMSRIFNFLKKKDPIFRKIRENFGNVQIIQKIIQIYSVVSLVYLHRDVDEPLEISTGIEMNLPR